MLHSWPRIDLDTVYRTSDPDQLLFLNRILCICFGEYYWLYGCMILYMLYGFVFVFKIAKLFYPLDSEVVVIEAGLQDLWKSPDRSDAVKKGVNPAALLLLLSGLYLALLVAVGSIDFEGKKLSAITIGATGEALETYVAAGLSYGAVATVFFAFALARVMLRLSLIHI